MTAARRRTTIELETFRAHARRMSVKMTESEEDRRRWAQLADEAEEHLRRDDKEEGLFAIPEPRDEPTLF